MSKMAFAVALVVVLNAYIFLTQVSVNNLNPSGAPQFFVYAGSDISKYDKGSGSYVLEDNLTGRLPSTSSSVSPTTGNIFTDGWTATQQWFSTVGKGLDTLLSVVNAVPNFLKALGFPVEVSFALGYIWYAFSIFLIVAFIKGAFV